MRQLTKFYIDGRWVDPVGGSLFEAVNPATELQSGVIAMGSARDVDAAVTAARRAFEAWSETTPGQRRDYLSALLAEYNRRSEDIAQAVTEEMGAPISLTRSAHTFMGAAHLRTTIDILNEFAFEERRGATTVRREPVGVCALITPWNWPMNQILCKVAPALAAGCTMVLKPSEFSSFSAQIWAEIVAAAGLPAGVFNMVYGDGAGAGAALSAHPEVDMVSFTGSTRAGIEVARAAAPTVKRVTQEMGGKSPNLFLDDADFTVAVAESIAGVMLNSGQTCVAATRMLVPAQKVDEVKALAAQAAAAVTVGDPQTDVAMGPVVSRQQWLRVQRLIHKGIEEGASLVAGGEGRPEGLNRGFYVRPTIFADVRNDMTIAREEIFGPVIAIIEYDNEDEAVRIANDTPYGLSSAIQSRDPGRAQAIARRIRAGQVCINNPGLDLRAPFGGYKQSGNGREWGDYGLQEFLEIKSIMTPVNS